MNIAERLQHRINRLCPNGAATVDEYNLEITCGEKIRRRWKPKTCGIGGCPYGVNKEVIDHAINTVINNP